MILHPEATRTLSQAHNALGIGVPVTVTSVMLIGIGLQDWVYIATLIVAATQIVRACFAGWCWWERRKSRRANRVVTVTTPENLP